MVKKYLPVKVALKVTENGTGPFQGKIMTTKFQDAENSCKTVAGRPSKVWGSYLNKSDPSSVVELYNRAVSMNGGSTDVFGKDACWKIAALFRNAGSSIGFNK